MAQWYDGAVDNMVALHEARQRQLIQEREDKLVAFVLKAADRAGQQVARFDEYITSHESPRGGFWIRVKIVFIDGRHVRGWYDGGRWKFGDDTWQRYRGEKVARRGRVNDTLTQWEDGSSTDGDAIYHSED